MAGEAIERRSDKDRRENANGGRRAEDKQVRQELKAMEALVLNEIRKTNVQIRKLAKQALLNSENTAANRNELRAHVAGCDLVQRTNADSLAENTGMTRAIGETQNTMRETQKGIDERVRKLAEYVEPRIEMEQTRSQFWKMAKAMLATEGTPWPIKAFLLMLGLLVAGYFGGADAMRELLHKLIAG